MHPLRRTVSATDRRVDDSVRRDVDPISSSVVRWFYMTLAETLVSVWKQVLVEEKTAVEVDGELAKVKETRSSRLRSARFTYGGHVLDAIEQNPRTASRWAKLAQEGKRIMQFSCQGRYIANVCEGELLRYSAWQALNLPE